MKYAVQWKPDGEWLIRKLPSGLLKWGDRKKAKTFTYEQLERLLKEMGTTWAYNTRHEVVE